MKELTLTLPLAPALNHYWKHSAHRGYLHTYISKKGLIFRDLVLERVYEYRKSFYYENDIGFSDIVFPVERLTVELQVFGDSRRKYDIDGRIKATLDALQIAKVYTDDEQVDRLFVERKEIVKGGKMIITIKALTGSSLRPL